MNLSSRALDALSVFPQDFTAEAADRVIGECFSAAASELIAKGVVASTFRLTPRYVVHFDYQDLRLPDPEHFRAAHAAYYLDLAITITSHLGTPGARALDAGALEVANFALASDWYLDAGDIDACVSIERLLGHVLWKKLRADEALPRVRKVLAATAELPPRPHLHYSILHLAVLLARAVGEPDRDFVRELRRVHVRGTSQTEVIRVVTPGGGVAVLDDDIRVIAPGGDAAFLDDAELQRAERAARQELRKLESRLAALPTGETGDKLSEARTRLASYQLALGQLATASGALQEAIPRFEEAISLFEQALRPLDAAIARWEIVKPLAALHQEERAASLLMPCLALYQALGDLPTSAVVTRQIGILDARLGNWERAKGMLAAAREQLSEYSEHSSIISKINHELELLRHDLTDPREISDDVLQKATDVWKAAGFSRRLRAALPIRMGVTTNNEYLSDRLKKGEEGKTNWDHKMEFKDMNKVFESKTEKFVPGVQPADRESFRWWIRVTLLRAAGME